MPSTFVISSDNRKVSEENKSRFTSALIKHLGLAIFIFLAHATAALAQHDTTQQIAAYDSLKTDSDSVKSDYNAATDEFIRLFKQLGVEELQKSILEYHEDTIVTKQDKIIEEVRKLTSEAKNYLKNGLDTSGLSEQLKKFEHWYEITSDGVFINRGTLETNRNLETSSGILKELLTRTLAWKSSLDDNYKDLVAYRNKIDSLKRDSVLYKFSSDSAALMSYVKKLVVAVQEVRPTDSAFKKTLTNLSEVQTTVNRFVNKLNSGIEQIDIFQKELSGKAFGRETTNLLSPRVYTRPFTEIIHISMIKGLLSLAFYVRNNMGWIVLLLILVVILNVFLVNLKRHLQSQNLIDQNVQGQLVLKYPFLSAVVIVFTLFQFIFVDPPFIFNVLLWTISTLSLTIIVRNFVTRYWMFVWYLMFFLFLLACTDNLILQASRTERWIMTALSIAGLISGLTIIAKGRRQELREKLSLYFIGFVAIMQAVSIVANLYGRYNISKTFLTSGFFNIAIAVLFLWTVRFIYEGLSLVIRAYKIPGKKLLYINFDRADNKVPLILYVLFFIGWFVLVARNFYIYKLITGPIKDFINEERTIGDFSFSIGNMLEFFLILYLSGLISQIVSFFATNRFTESTGGKDKKGVGSWLLIIRISIISIGLLLAFAAAGIPMDRVTIIVSALSVGIGFGLQTLVNNLVSGLIISFEKPVTVGDIIEIGTHSGTVKSIGFRSSIISIPNGSDMVIPNGDLLNQHLVNWTHGNTFRCVDIAIGVAYGTDLAKAIQILKDLPAKDERILSSPPPGVIIQNFNSSSITMLLSFWVQNIREWVSVKSDIILAIDIAFKEHGIEIPVPQQDIRILSATKDGRDDKNEIEKNQ
ncbi:MAG TPA: mechanosensitive ion channel domain-containing protein [Parafilimonas sp.]|nr:mechanosensitive ion channel domain-containing protein [Parafilimonas sp.]